MAQSNDPAKVAEEAAKVAEGATLHVEDAKEAAAAAAAAAVPLMRNDAIGIDGESIPMQSIAALLDEVGCIIKQYFLF